MKHQIKSLTGHVPTRARTDQEPRLNPTAHNHDLRATASPRNRGASVDPGLAGVGRWALWEFSAMLCMAADVTTTVWDRAMLVPSSLRMLLGGSVELRLITNRNGIPIGLSSGFKTLLEIPADLLAASMVIAGDQPPLVAIALGTALSGGAGHLFARYRGLAGSLPPPRSTGSTCRPISGGSAWLMSQTALT